MDFFDHQEQARRKTGRLVLLFSLAVAFLIAGLYFVVQAALVFYFGFDLTNGLEYPWDRFWRFNPQVFWWVTLITLAIVLLGSIYKILELQGGGAAVAKALGGRRIKRSSKQPQERQLLNVVDEMAIASGIPAPPVYVMDAEPGLNAFAAGFTPDDAVIGVTRGALDLFSREELQGVIAHEFSHILNGDMRLNIQLMGLIHGILIIGLIGRGLLRGSVGRRRYRSGFSRSSGKNTGAVAALGLAIMAVGYLGVLFGNLIKAAVSRQREFLADASAVQFTRYPAGITGALKKIGGLAEGSVMLDPESMTISHMFFSQGLFGGLDGLFATHPDLLERIRRIEPRFNGRFPAITRPAVARTGEVGDRSAGRTVSAFVPPSRPAAPLIPVVTPRKPARKVVKQDLPDPIALIGNPTAAHLDYANRLLDQLPPAIRDAANELHGARALVYSLLLSPEASIRQDQLARVRADDAEAADALAQWPASSPAVDPATRLPLLDLTVPTLDEMSPQQYRAFTRTTRALIQADRKVEPVEWMLQHVLLRHLEPRFHKARKPIAQYYSLKRLGEPCSMLLSTLAYANDHDDETARRAFRQGEPYLGADGLTLLPRERCTLVGIDHALDTLVQCSPREKRKLIQACTACVLADRTVTVEEAELLRAVSDALDCPMPPLLAGQSVGRPAASPTRSTAAPAAPAHA